MVGDRDDPVNTEKASRDRKSKSKVIADPTPRPPPAVPMPPGDFDLPNRRKPLTDKSRANGRSFKQGKADDDIVMVDAGGPSENIGGLKRSDSSAKRASLGGVLGGLLSKSRPEPKRRNTALTDDEATRGLRHEDRKIKRTAKEDSEPRGTDRDVTMSGGAVDEDQEARREARRVRRAEREAAEKAADEARRARDEERRERRRKQEEESEVKLQEEKEARRAARREQRAKEETERLAAEAKEQERAERRRARRADREAQLDAEQQEADSRAKKSERRKSYMEGPTDDDEDRRRRREERRRTSYEATPRTSRRKSTPVVDSHHESRSGKKSEYLPAEGPVYTSSKKKSAWPHSGTDSWVQEHSDAPPPPEDTPPVDDEPADDPIADENARRELKKARRRSKYDEVDEGEERRRRKESRRAEREGLRSSEGSQGDGRRSSYRDSGYVAPSREPSAQGGLFSRFRKIAGV